MDKLVKRITEVRPGKEKGGTVIYRREKPERRKGSELARPLEQAARSVLRADAILADEGLRLHDKSNERRRDGWLLDAPINAAKAHRKAYKEVRKAAPFKLLPKI
jgi:Family of unknown function (DUF6312)